MKIAPSGFEHRLSATGHVLAVGNRTESWMLVSGSQDRKMGAAVRIAPGGGAADEHPEVAVVPDASAGQVLVQLGVRNAAGQVICM